MRKSQPIGNKQNGNNLILASNLLMSLSGFAHSVKPYSFHISRIKKDKTKAIK